MKKQLLGRHIVNFIIAAEEGGGSGDGRGGVRGREGEGGRGGGGRGGRERTMNLLCH